MTTYTTTLKSGSAVLVAVFRASEMSEVGSRRSYAAARLAAEAGCGAWEIRDAHPTAGPEWVCERGSVAAPLRTMAQAEDRSAPDDRGQL